MTHVVRDARKWVKLELDTLSFDADSFRPYVERCRRSGIEFRTMAELNSDPATIRSLYELNRECSADIPERGSFYTLDEFVDQRVNTVSYDPQGVVIALDDTEWVGMAATSDWSRNGYVFNEMTGVKSSHRCRGIAVAMKVLGIAFADECQVTKVRTFHHPLNASAIGLNRKLGYVEADFSHP